MADVVVVGGGIVGLAAADALALRGAEVLVLERGEPGEGQSAGVARGFRHLHATAAQIDDAVRARALWDDWSARLRACGVAAEVVERAGDRHPALAADAGPLLWDPRGGAIRGARAIAWLRDRLDVRRTAVTAVAPGRVVTDEEALACGTVLVCAGAETDRLWPHVTMRRTVHLRVTFAAPEAADDAASWGAATWGDRSGAYGARTYGVADGPGRFALGLAELGAQPAPEDPDAAPPDLAPVRARVHAYARAAFPGLGAPVGEVVRVLTVLPGEDEDAYVVHREAGLAVVAGHNLYKLAPLIAERLAANL